MYSILANASEARDEKQQQDYPEGLWVEEERGGEAVGPREPREVEAQERTRYFASSGAATGGCRFQPSPGSMRDPHVPLPSPGFPEAQRRSENHGGKQMVAGPSDTSTTYKTGCLSDVP